MSDMLLGGFVALMIWKLIQVPITAYGAAKTDSIDVTHTHTILEMIQAVIFGACAVLVFVGVL